MNRVVAFEGPDRAGKTTLLGELRRIKPYDRWPLFRYEVTSALIEDTQSGEVDSIDLAWHENLIRLQKQMSFLLDRSFPSGYVYSKIMGRPHDAMRMDMLVQKLAPVVVYVCTPLHEVIQRFNRVGDNMHSRIRLVAVHAEYERFFEAYPFPNKVIVADGAANDLPAEARRIAEELSAWKEPWAQ
jgi:thymidylate kinase